MISPFAKVCTFRSCFATSESIVVARNKYLMLWTWLDFSSWYYESTRVMQIYARNDNQQMWVLKTILAARLTKRIAICLVHKIRPKLLTYTESVLQLKVTKHFNSIEKTVSCRKKKTCPFFNFRIFLTVSRAATRNADWCLKCIWVRPNMLNFVKFWKQLNFEEILNEGF